MTVSGDSDAVGIGNAKTHGFFDGGLGPLYGLNGTREGRIPAHPVSGSARHTWRFKLSEIGLFFECHPQAPTIAIGRPNPADKGKQ